MSLFIFKTSYDVLQMCLEYNKGGSKKYVLYLFFLFIFQFFPLLPWAVCAWLYIIYGFGSDIIWLTKNAILSPNSYMHNTQIIQVMCRENDKFYLLFPCALRQFENK